MSMKKLLLLLAFFICVNHVFAQKMKPQETEVWEPEPVVVTPGEGTAPPRMLSYYLMEAILITGKI